MFPEHCLGVAAMLLPLDMCTLLPRLPPYPWPWIYMYESPQQSQNCELWEPAVVVFITALICSLWSKPETRSNTRNVWRFESWCNSNFKKMGCCGKLNEIILFIYSEKQMFKLRKRYNLKKQQGHFEFFLEVTHLLKTSMFPAVWDSLF